MEAVPRLPMVCFELRTPADNTSFGPKLKEYIRDFYHEDPETYNLEIGQLETLRAAAVRPGRDIAGVANLKRYYCQLHFLMSRFPMTKDGAAAVQFSWRDMYIGMSFSVADIRYEISSVLYNIGALHTQLGMSDTRTTEDGMKMACTHFQCAAWAFQHLKDTYPPSTEADIAPDIMQFAYHMCLAQAQECILEKSMMDNRKASIIVKVAVQVVNYYSQAFSALKQSVSEEAVGTKIYTGWRRLAKFKEIYYRCVIQLFQGMQAEEQQKMGERVAFYQIAHDTLEEAIKLSKNLDKGEMNPKQVQEALSFTQDVVEGKRKAAKNENEFIYHEEVPDRDQLPKAMGVSLVKGIPFGVNDSEVSGPDIFGRLVPMKAHEASSLYSEEKAKLLRKVGGSIEEKDQQLTAFLSSLQLEYLHCYSEPNQLPQELVDRCAALSAKPNAIQSLVESMSKLSEVCTEVETMLQEIKGLLQTEETLEREYQAIIGKRPPSIVATDMTREAMKYQEAHSKANESNQALHKVMSTHISNLHILSLPLSQVQQQIPPPPSLSDPESESIVKEMQTLMEKVEEMRNQRAMLITQLRDSICKDDITQILVTQQNGNLEALFQEELKKHQDIVKLIQQNLSAQDNILKAVTDSYARYSHVRKATTEAVRKRQSVINALISCFDAYEDLLAKSSKGHEFYNILETNVIKLLGRVKSTCKVQQEEREQMLLKTNAVLPPKVKNNVANVVDVPATVPKVHAAPKLKDYLNPDGGISLPTRSPQAGNYFNSDVVPTGYTGPGLYNPVPVVTSAQSMTYYDPSAGVSSDATMPKASSDSKPPNWMPGIRPAPLGSEATTSVFMSEPSDVKNVAYAAHTPYPPQVYNYAGAWGYGSQASTMSTYLPPDVHFPMYSKSTGSPIPEAAHQYNNQEHRATPVGGASYPSGSSEVPGHTFALPQVNNHLSSGGYKNVPSNPVLSPAKHAMDNPSQMYQGQTSYETYHPSISTTPSHQYNVQSTFSNYQMPSPYESSATGVASAVHQNVVGSGQVGTSGFGSSTNASQFSSSLPQPLGCYEQQVLPNYQSRSNMAATSVSQALASAYSQQMNFQNLNNPSAGAASQLQLSYQSMSSVPAGVGAHHSMSNPTAVSASQTAYPYSQQYHGSWPASSSSGVTVNPTYPSYQTPLPSSTQQFHYMENQNISSYSSAGAYPTNQTSSSYSSHTQTLGYDSNALGAARHYFQTPPYGSQNCSNGNVDTGVTQSLHPGNQQDYAAQGMYMQARMPNSDSYTTDSPKISKSSSAENASSNVDLLAGLDFSINHQPLVPQQGSLSVTSESKNLVQSTAISANAELFVANKQDGNVSKNLLSSDSSTDALIDSLSVLQIPGEQSSKAQNQRTPPKDPFQDKDYLQQFTQEVEKFEKFVEGLTLKTLNGPTLLDMKWKEIIELQEKDTHRRSISVARCYPMKNRFPDILPYDCSRVELPSTKDDYINASHLKNLTPSTPPFILTQLPLPSTYNDFWIMVHEQQIEVVICLLNDMELDGQSYWPVEKNQEMSVGRMRLSLQTANVKQHWTERILSVYDAETRVSRVVVHLQFTAWPGSSFPPSPGPFLSFVSECLAFYNQQRIMSHPLLVHCSSGVGRTGLFCLVSAAVCEIQAGRGLIDLVTLTVSMSERRKAALRDREHLKFAYLSLLYYAQDILMKCGILTSGSTFEDKRSRSEGKCHTRHPSQDFLLGPPAGLSQLQSGIENMGLDSVSHIEYCSSQEIRRNSEQGVVWPPTDSENTEPVSNGSHIAESLKSLSQEQLSKPKSKSIDPFGDIDPLWPLKRS